MTTSTSAPAKNARQTGSPAAKIAARPDRTLEWLGSVNYENLGRIMGGIKALMIADPAAEITLLVTSYGGPTGIGMSFHDAMKSWLKPNLVTIGSGDVDSSGITIFLSGAKRLLTKNTTLLLHMAGRTLEGGKRLTTADFEAMLKEDRLKDYQYACVVSDGTGGTYSPEEILGLMAKNSILTAQEAVSMGLAHGIVE